MNDKILKFPDEKNINKICSFLGSDFIIFVENSEEYLNFYSKVKKLLINLINKNYKLFLCPAKPGFAELIIKILNELKKEYDIIIFSMFFSLEHAKLNDLLNKKSLNFIKNSDDCYLLQENLDEIVSEIEGYKKIIPYVSSLIVDNSFTEIDKFEIVKLASKYNKEIIYLDDL